MSHKFLALKIGLLLCLFFAGGAASAPTNQSLEGALAGVAADVRDLLKKDRRLQGRKINLDDVSRTRIPRGNYDQIIQETLEKLLENEIDETSNLLLTIEYTYLVSDQNTNRGNRVIQIEAKLSEDGLPVIHNKILREVNNTADISSIVGNTVTPPDTQDYKQRLTAVETAFKDPTFNTVGNTQVQATGNKNYSVEIRKRVGGKGDAIPIVPINQSGLAFAPIEIADTYEIVLFNYDQGADAVAKVSIDGLDAINTFNADVDATGKKVAYPGYFIPRATASGPGVHVIPGWLHTVKPANDNVFEFVVNKLGQGAASELKVRGKTGVITVRFFDSYRPDEKPRGRNFGETGKGQPRKQDYQLVESVIGTEPLSIVTVRYSRAPE
jgi:hypothetical protein